MPSKYAPEAIDSTLRDLMDGAPFGGKTIVLSGKCRQCCPNIKFGTAIDVVDEACFSTRL